jgi:CRP/FNR family transcriptional regulator
MKKYCKHCIYESLPHTLVSFNENENIFLEGTTIHAVYRIKDGLVKMNRVHASGDEKVFDILGPGDYIALLAVLQEKTLYIASAMALTKVTAIRIGVDAVLDAYQSNNIFQQSCLHCAVTRSNMFQDKLFQTTNIDTEEKILGILQILANKYGTEQDGIVKMTLPFSKTVLANIIGIRRETLSRKLSQMQKDHIIEMDKNTYIFDRL